jgi:SH3-like domain-containing protein|tara:strand:+ start:1197 stop:1706 length:510 start_codon:yes stop_codon:yes gene_type:complete
MKLFIAFLIIPTFAICDSFPSFNSLKYEEVNLRHYPEKDDPNLKTIKFKLTERGMPVKILRDYNAGGNITEWYQVELFNGITGWVYHNQLSKKRKLLLKEDKNLYLFSSSKEGSFKTQIKAKIISPKIVSLIKIKNNMAKIEINQKKKTTQGWILLDNSIWGLSKEEQN